MNGWERLRRIASVLGVFCLAFLSVVFLGTEAQAYNGWSVGAWSSSSFTSGGYVHNLTAVSQTAGSVGTSTWAPQFTLNRTGSGTNVGWFWLALCADPADLSTITSTASGSYSSTTYPRTTSVPDCTAPAVRSEIRVWSQTYATFALAPSEARIKWTYLEEDTSGTDFCGASVLSNVHVWENGDGVGFSFKWGGTTNWARWRIHKAGNLAVSYPLDGYVAAGAAAGFFRSDNDPPVTSVFNAGDTVKLRRYGDSTNGDPTDCWVSVTVGSTPFDWTTEGDSGGGGGGPDDYGGGTDPELETDCGTFDVFCRIKSALAWAFVPSEATLDGLDDDFSALGDKVPFSLFVYATELMEVMTPGQSDCAVAAGGVDAPGYVTQCWPEWEIGGFDVFPLASDGGQWLKDNRGLIEFVLYISIFGSLLIGMAWHLLPVVGDGGRSGSS